MPNPGGPYGGCDACRRRKVKCDQTYPACQKCIKRKITCPGVKDSGAQIFRDESRKIAAKVEFRERSWRCLTNISRERAAATREDAVDKRQNHSHTIDMVTGGNHFESVPDHLSAPQEDVLTTFFFDQFTCPDVGLYEYLPHIHRKAAQDGYLTLAIQAASLFVFANRCHDHSSLVAQARMTYSKALSALNMALGDENERLKDEMLCAVIIINVIDDITGSRDHSCRFHLSGLQQLLRLRKSLGIQNIFGAEVWHSVAIESQPLTLCIHNKDRSSSKILIPQMLVAPIFTTYETCEAVGHFSDCVEKVLSNDSLSLYGDDSLIWLLWKSKKLDSALQTWSNENQGVELEARWRRYVAPTPPNLSIGATVEYFNSIQTARIWNQNRCIRIHLHLTILDLAEYILGRKSSTVDFQTGHEIVKTIAESRQIINKMLDCICYSIPFNLRRINSAGERCADQSQRVFGGAGLVWPLEVVLSCRCSSTMHRILARDALCEIGHSIGVRQALVDIEK